MRIICKIAVGITRNDIFVLFKERKKLTQTFTILNTVRYTPKIPRYLATDKYSLPPRNRFITKFGKAK